LSSRRTAVYQLHIIAVQTPDSPLTQGGHSRELGAAAHIKFLHCSGPAPLHDRQADLQVSGNLGISLTIRDTFHYRRFVFA
jgi:hypothetical protein